jgi:predicted transcriptional regulator
MSRKSVHEIGGEASTVEKSVISGYVRLCLDEGIKPSEAFKEMKRKLHAFKELKSKTVT